MKYLLEPNIFILLVFRTARRCIRQTRKSFVMSLRVLKMPYVHLSLYAWGVRSKTHLDRKTHVFRSHLWNDTVLSSNLCLWRISSWHAIQCAVNAVWMAVLLWGMMMRKFPHMPHIDVIIWGVINIFLISACKTYRYSQFRYLHNIVKARKIADFRVIATSAIDGI